MQHPWRTIILTWLVLLSLGIVGLVWIYSRVLPGILTPSASSAPEMREETSATATPTESEVVTALQAQVTQLSQRVSTLEFQATASGKAKTVVVNNTTTTVAPAPAAKVGEAFLPMGGGSTDNRDWTTLTGAQIAFDPKKFGQVVSVRFEAAGYIIGGEVHARLIDVTHNTTYYNTELIFNTNSPTWKRSAKFQIPATPTTFQVQIQSSSGETAYLQDSRLVLETKN